MVNLDALPDPGDPGWDNRVEEIVEGTGIDNGLGKRLLRDATRVKTGDRTLESFAGQYPTQVVETLGIDEELDGCLDVATHQRDMPIDYSGSETESDESSPADVDDLGAATADDTGCCGGNGSCGCGSNGSRGCDSNGSCSCGEGEKKESVLDREFTPEEALEREVPENLFPDLDDTTEMEDLGQSWDMDDVDDEWEANARKDLADVEFGTELGVEMSRDALRIAQGEMTKAEFHEKYNDRVLKEFGVDHRPTRTAEPAETDDSSSDITYGSVEADGWTVPDENTSVPKDNTSRRRFLKGATATAAGASASIAGCLDLDVAQQGTNPASHDGDVQLGMAIDMERCIGCLLCAEGCMEENNTDLGSFWMHVFQYEEDERGDTVENYMPRPCQHCSEPSCSYVCPTQARYKRDGDGLVLTNYDTCIGCKYCQVACPYGVNYLGKDEGSDKSPGFWHPTEEDEQGITAAGPAPEGVMSKCTFCSHRQDEDASRGTTACEDACPVDAIHFGDMEDPDSDPREHMREKRNTARFELLENQGNEPNIVYLGDEPSGSAETVDGPYTYRDLEMEPLDEPANDGETAGGDD